MCILNSLGLIRRAERSRLVCHPSIQYLARLARAMGLARLSARLVFSHQSRSPQAPLAVSLATHAHPDGITREEVFVMADIPHSEQGEQAGRPIQRSPVFQQAWQELSASLQRTVERKIVLLVANPAHPSLKAHRVKRLPHADVWICYVSATLRLLYQRKEHGIYLLDVGPHHIIDRVHLRCFPDAAPVESSDGSQRPVGASQPRPSAQRGRAHKRKRGQL